VPNKEIPEEIINPHPLSAATIQCTVATLLFVEDIIPGSVIPDGLALHHGQWCRDVAQAARCTSRLYAQTTKTDHLQIYENEPSHTFTTLYCPRQLRVFDDNEKEEKKNLISSKVLHLSKPVK